MKKQTVSFQFDTTPAPFRPLRLTDAAAGVLLLAGIWGLLWQCLRPESVPGLLGLGALAALGLAAGLLLRWDRKWQRAALCGALLVLLAAGVLLRGHISAALAGLGDLWGQWRFQQTGRYTPPYVGAGSVWWLLLPMGAVMGLAAGLVLRRRWRIWPAAVCAAGLLALRLAGLVPGGWWFTCFLLGMLLCFVQGSAIGRRAKALTAGALALVLLMGLLPEGLSGGASPTALGRRLGKALHRWHYEDAADPLPEGDISGSGAFSPGQEPALRLTMEHWTPLYLRGYVAGEYTGTGWQQLAARRLTEEAPMLYSLQSGYFFPAQQLAKANGEAESENHVTIQVLGACRSVAYTPYGGGDGLESALDARDLTGEGMTDPTQRSYEAALYPVEESYLLQQQLAQAEADSDYRTGESVYRQWVYDHYLTVPQDTYDALTAQFTPGQGWNTTQAKTEISRFLAANLTLREGTVTPATGDVAAWLLTGARQGYSVHYATLATLLLRCCGIPARYVEGYVVTRQQAEALSDGAQLTLTQRAAHAWAEYYLDGVGWIPFDTVPGYEENISYQLPEDGDPAENENGTTYTGQDQTPQQNQTDISQEPQDDHSQRIFIQSVLLALAALVLVCLAAMALRTVLLRRRLKRQRRRFEDPDGRAACQAMLSALHRQLTALQPEAWSEASPRRQEALTALLGDETARQLTALEQEVWFSDHPIEEPQRQQAQKLLEGTERLWRERVPAARRWKQRFLTCQVI